LKLGGWHRLFVAVGILWGLVLGAFVEFGFPQDRIDFIKQAIPVRLNGGQAPWWGYADIDVLPPLPDGFVLDKTSAQSEKKYFVMEDAVTVLAPRSLTDEQVVKAYREAASSYEKEQKDFYKKQIFYALRLYLAPLCLIYFMAVLFAWVRRGFAPKIDQKPEK
jgi:hypothetical protein